ncbi:MAG: SAM-dependent methyltransferase [Clostridia bacterium]|nr:SAM-dependent methyltransferase [Clostridia bacterium]
MNQQQKSKIELFFGGFSERYRTASEYFAEVTFDFVSGRKTYSGKILRIEDGFEYRFSGKRNAADLPQALQFLLDDLLKYDSAIVRYKERGLTTELHADGRNVKIVKREEANEVVSVPSAKGEYQIDLRKASKLMTALGYCDKDGKLRNDMIRKYNQTNHILELISDLFEGKNDITVVDCACGKSYLSFVLNYYLWEEKRIRAHFVGIDISPKVIEASKKIAQELGYTNMEFICEDLRTYESDFHPDVVVSLHACDTATDMALGYALRHHAESIVCVPCCHKELLKQYKIESFEPLTKHGVFRARLNDLITDGLRSMKLESEGYEVRCVEFCSPIDTPKNLLISAKKVAKENRSVKEQYYDLLSQWKVRPSMEYYSAIPTDLE